MYDASGSRAQVFVLLNNTFADNAGDAFFSSASGSVTFGAHGNLFYGNGGIGINLSVDTGAAARALANGYNGYGANGGPNVNWPAGVRDQTLTANPFVNDSNGNADFGLNQAAGGGALLRQKGFPEVCPGLSAGPSGHVDIGAVQSAGSGGAGGGQRSLPFVQ
jgi:hypothetical protein